MGEGRRLFRSAFRSADPLTPAEVFSNLPVLQTPRLTLRKMTMRDAGDLYAYSRDPEVARHVLWDAHRSIMDTRAYLRFIIHQYHDGLPSSYCMVLKETGHVIGTIGFMAYSDENSFVEVGYSLARDQWNKGLTTEALQAVIDLAFRQLRVNRVEAMHECSNPASGRVMVKCGMQHEGTLRGRVFNKGRYVDVEFYAILRQDWESGNRHRRDERRSTR